MCSYAHFPDKPLQTSPRCVMSSSSSALPAINKYIISSGSYMPKADNASTPLNCNALQSLTVCSLGNPSQGERRRSVEGTLNMRMTRGSIDASVHGEDPQQLLCFAVEERHGTGQKDRKTPVVQKGSALEAKFCFCQFRRGLYTACSDPQLAKRESRESRTLRERFTYQKFLSAKLCDSFQHDRVSVVLQEKASLFI